MKSAGDYRQWPCELSRSERMPALAELFRVGSRNNVVVGAFVSSTLRISGDGVAPHVVVDTAPACSLEEGEGVIVRVEYHAGSRAETPYKQRSTVAQLDICALDLTVMLVISTTSWL